MAREMYISAFSLHPVGMPDLTVTDAGAWLADVVDQALVRHDPIYLIVGVSASQPSSMPRTSTA